MVVDADSTRGSLMELMANVIPSVPMAHHSDRNDPLPESICSVYSPRFLSRSLFRLLTRNTCSKLFHAPINVDSLLEPRMVEPRYRNEVGSGHIEAAL